MRIFFDRLPAFIAVGGVATALHWSLMYLLIHQSWHPAPATAAGGAAGLVAAYCGHSCFTFGADSHSGSSVLRFLLMAGLGWLINILLFLVLSACKFAVPVAQVLATAGATLSNYIVSRRFVFYAGYRHDS